MRNPASPGGTPSQHNSTLAISPFMVNRNARFQPQPTAITQQTNNNGTSHDTNPVPNNNNSTNPFHHVMNSPLGQKIPKKYELTISYYYTTSATKQYFK